MAGKRNKFNRKVAAAPELNVMPFIDIFSMLNTFLLVSASFIGLGILEVQVPFLSNSPEVSDSAPTRTLNIRVDLDESKIVLTTIYSEPPENKVVKTYNVDEADIDRFHQDLIAMRTKDPDSDKVTLYSDDNVKYEKVILVLDAIKTMKESEPDLQLPPPKDKNKPATRSGRMLYDKVVIGSVIL